MQDQVRELHGRGLRDPDIAEQLGVSTSRVNRIRKRLRLKTHAPWRATPKIDDRKGRELHAQGLVDREIADRLGVSRELVQKWRVRERLPSNGWRQRKAASSPAPRQRQ